MRVGVARERKDGEHRVGLLPEGVAARVASNHELLVRRGAGERSGVDDWSGQGGIAETSRMISLSDPTYVEEAVTHSCVANMPALVARSATLARARATLPYGRSLADIGIDAALAIDAGLRKGLQIRNGAVTHAGLAADSDLAHGGA